MSDSAWRDFERMVATIERHFSPQGATVKSPDFCEDLRTGQKREVDGSIRYRVGSTPILITLECRDRSATQDVTWIEQLASKRDAIGAACTVAVSASGFSEPALRAARFHGIQTRLLREIDDEAARVWASQMEIIAFRAVCRTLSMRVSLFEDRTQEVLTELDPSVIAEFAANADVKIFRRADGTEIAISDLLREHGLLRDDLRQTLGRGVSLTVPVPAKSSAQIASNTPNLLFDGLEPNEGRVPRTLTWDFEPEELLAKSTVGLRSIRQLSVDFEVELQAVPAVFGNVWSYSMEGGEVSKAVQGSIRLGDGSEMRVVVTDSPKT